MTVGFIEYEFIDLAGIGEILVDSKKKGQHLIRLDSSNTGIVGATMTFPGNQIFDAPIINNQ